MSLSAPKQLTFIISIVLAVVAILATLIPLGFVTGLSFWILALAFLVLALGVLLPDL